jgi:cytidine deaminase
MKDYAALIEGAIAAREKAYAPYSGFLVGAALLARDGQVFTGCNIENSGFTATNCAERTAFFKAVSEGVRDFEAIAVVGGSRGPLRGFCSPCGVCRQVMSEFCSPEEFKVVLGLTPLDYRVYTLNELLPLGNFPQGHPGGDYFTTQLGPKL